MGLGTLRVNGPAIAMHAPRWGPARRLALMKACADSLSIEIDNSGRHQCEAHLAGGRLGSRSSRSFARVEFTPRQYENWQEISVNQGIEMGGFGSTRWGSTSTSGMVEGARSLDINRLNRAGCLRAGYYGGWEWTRDGERVASIQFWRKEDRLVLSYRVRQSDGEWQEVEQPTPIVWMPCRFGGARPYFVCPAIVKGIACGRRVTKLYGAATYFLCRHCYRLAYASQREDHCDRALRRANNIRMRLGGEPGIASLFPDRPKGMHHKTYEHLQTAVLSAEILAQERLAIVLDRLQRRERRVVGRSSKEFWR
jgi:hypothetical protein